MGVAMAPGDTETIRPPRLPNLAACEEQYHVTKFLLIEYANPGRILVGTTLHADVIFFTKTSWLRSAYL
jgi:hypothetical protein